MNDNIISKSTKSKSSLFFKKKKKNNRQSFLLCSPSIFCRIVLIMTNFIKAGGSKNTVKKILKFIVLYVSRNSPIIIFPKNVEFFTRKFWHWFWLRNLIFSSSSTWMRCLVCHHWNYLEFYSVMTSKYKKNQASVEEKWTMSKGSLYL